jgi:hypothetical protein
MLETTYHVITLFFLIATAYCMAMEQEQPTKSYDPGYPIDLRTIISTFPIYMGDGTEEDHFVLTEGPSEESDPFSDSYYLGQDPTRWSGQISFTFLVGKSPSRQFKKDMNLGAILKKIAADFYRALSQSSFKISHSCLSRQKPMHTSSYLGPTNKKSILRIMLQCIEGYQNFADARTRLDDVEVSFMEFIEKCHRPPEKLLTPGGELVPLLGIMEICAAIRILADADGLGRNGKNAGFIWERDESDTIKLRAQQR